MVFFEGCVVEGEGGRVAGCCDSDAALVDPVGGFWLVITFLRWVLKSLGVRGKKIFSGFLSTPNFRDGELDQTSTSCTRCLPKTVEVPVMRKTLGMMVMMFIYEL